MHPFRFGLHASAAPDMAAWRGLARAGEALGYSTLYVTDHLDSQFGPLVAMAVAAEATPSLRVGTLVLNNDLRNPVVLAKEIATLGLAAEGRVEVGFGAGWLRSDYGAAGIGRDGPGSRTTRLSESLAIMKTLWRDGQVTFQGEHYTVADARCDPRPASPPRVIVGGGSERVLTVAAREADVVNTSLAVVGKGDRVAAEATVDHFDRCLGWVRDAAGDRFDQLELQVRVSSVVAAASRRAATRAATLLGFPGEEALGLPVLLIGTVDEMCERLLERRERWGFSNVVVPADALDTFAPVVARLAGT